ncbi:terminase gpA endonuclease subunit [Rhodopirellula halodulae]|uniref:terminase gpA endonuclease subunit n=1 Tax=Rhodopirellula halodulae TaxID=2894198 RepID=UPI001E32BE0D|nr:terminase gpA endonuclease subunit [Rhodopirellula sp. JC737]
MCKYDLLLFLQAYFPGSTGLGPFGQGQIEAITRLERAILHHGRFVNAMPRGFSKSTISELALLWAILYGHRSYGVILAATKDAADQAIHGMMTEVQENDLLFEDFPEACVPIRRLEGKPQRCNGQTFMGQKTHPKLNADQLVFPRIPGSLSSESVIQARVINSIRGLRHKRTSGAQIRPDFVILDDIQTDSLAVSPTQVEKLKQTIAKSVARLGGHGTNLSMVMNCTVIAEGDLVDQLCSDKHPEWQSIRIKMVPKMPDRLDDLWLKDYARIRTNYDSDDILGQEKAWEAATEFYQKNRKAMDTGSEVGWRNIPLPEGEISPLQHAINVLVDDGEAAFLSECQNSPKKLVAAGIREIRPAEIKNRTNDFDRFVIPDGTTEVVFHCDVHNAVLFYSVAAIKANFTAQIVDYGTFPEQPHNNFTLYTVRNQMRDVLGVPTVEEAVKEGVKAVSEIICGRDWVTPNGESVPVGLGLYDVGYLPDQVAAGIRASEFKQILMGARGRFIELGRMAMTDYDTSRKRMLRCGPNPRRPRWYVPPESINGVHTITFDANYWKSVAAARLTQDRETPGEWSLFGNHRTDHGAYAEHLAAEEAIERSEKGQTGIVWKKKPNRDNHFWDSFVGCVVAASVKGVQLPGFAMPIKKVPVQKNPPQQKQQQQTTRSAPKGHRSFWVTAR